MPIAKLVVSYFSIRMCPSLLPYYFGLAFVIILTCMFPKLAVGSGPWLYTELLHSSV